MRHSLKHRSNHLEMPAREPRWYAVRTLARHEKRVEERFKIREIECFLPSYQTQKRWRDQTNRTLRLPLFPNYVFVHIGPDGRVPVLAVPGVLGIVGGGRGADTIPDACICSLRQGVERGMLQPHPLLTTGTVVQVRAGVMAGQRGILIRHKGRHRVVITLEVIMNSATVEVALDEIEAAGPNCRP